MRMPTIVLGLVIGAACAVMSATRLTAQQPLSANDPGHPVPARVTVLNHDRSEAIPVVSTEPVEISDRTPIAVHSSTQAWEYRSVTIAATQDLAAALDGLGAEGWEAVGLAARTSGEVVLLKRPR